MSKPPGLKLDTPLRWRGVYRETELYKATIRVYTKPLFQWRKALVTSTDGKTLYDLAAQGLPTLGAIHRALESERFQFRPAVALRYNFNGKHRTLYLSPWEERIVDLLLYRILNARLRKWFSPHSYAYRDRTLGLDRCQARIARVIGAAGSPVYLVKRDIADYFASVDHDLLLEQLALLVDSRDYFFRLLEQRVKFPWRDESGERRATVGIPFGSAVACVLANIYLTPLDRELDEIASASYFRYADDILVLSTVRVAAVEAKERLEQTLGRLRLKVKSSQRADLTVSREAVHDLEFADAREFRHLGLLFRAGGDVALSRDKRRKIQNLFRFAFRRGRRKWKKAVDPRTRAQALVALALETIEKGVRNVAILDYYLKHVDDEAQLRLIDRWLAEEVLSLIFGGHQKGHFRRIGFRELRRMGLPSLVHRRRLIRRGKIESPFFIWERQRALRAFRGTVARLDRASGAAPAFSPCPEAAASKRL